MNSGTVHTGTMKTDIFNIFLWAAKTERFFWDPSHFAEKSPSRPPACALERGWEIGVYRDQQPPEAQDSVLNIVIL
jgi:hypothetical protein